MSTRLKSLAADRVYGLLAAIGREHHGTDLVPEPADYRDGGRRLVMRWPPIGPRQVVVQVWPGNAAVYWVADGQILTKLRVNPAIARYDLLSLVKDALEWAQGGRRS